MVIYSNMAEGGGSALLSTKILTDWRNATYTQTDEMTIYLSIVYCKDRKPFGFVNKQLHTPPINHFFVTHIPIKHTITDSIWHLTNCSDPRSPGPLGGRCPLAVCKCPRGVPITTSIDSKGCEICSCDSRSVFDYLILQIKMNHISWEQMWILLNIINNKSFCGLKSILVS